MVPRTKITTLLLTVLLCISVTLLGTAATGGSGSLSAAMEDMAVGGGGRCTSFLNGFILGMGIASLFGCIWCPGAAVASKAVQMLAC